MLRLQVNDKINPPTKLILSFLQKHFKWYFKEVKICAINL